jgi:hypothetical protein
MLFVLGGVVFLFVGVVILLKLLGFNTNLKDRLEKERLYGEWLKTHEDEVRKNM